MMRRISSSGFSPSSLVAAASTFTSSAPATPTSLSTNSSSCCSSASSSAASSTVNTPRGSTLSFPSSPIVANNHQSCSSFSFPHHSQKVQHQQRQSSTTFTTQSVRATPPSSSSSSRHQKHQPASTFFNIPPKFSTTSSSAFKPTRTLLTPITKTTVSAHNPDSISTFGKYCRAIDQYTKLQAEKSSTSATSTSHQHQQQRFTRELEENMAAVARALNITDTRHLAPATIEDATSGERMNVVKADMHNVFIFACQPVPASSSSATSSASSPSKKKNGGSGKESNNNSNNQDYKFAILNTNTGAIDASFPTLNELRADEEKRFDLASKFMQLCSMNPLAILIPEHDGASEQATEISTIINSVGCHCVVGPSTDEFVDVLLQREKVQETQNSEEEQQPQSEEEQEDFSTASSSSYRLQQELNRLRIQQTTLRNTRPVLSFSERQTIRKEILTSFGSSCESAVIENENAYLTEHLQASWNYLSFAGMNRKILFREDANFPELLHELVAPNANVLIISAREVSKHLTNEVDLAVCNIREPSRNTISGPIEDAVRLLTPNKKNGINILIPTRRSDRKLLRKLAYAVAKTGRHCILCYPRYINMDYAAVGTSDVVEWPKVCERLQRAKNPAFGLQDLEREALHAGGARLREFIRTYRRAEHAEEEHDDDSSHQQHDLVEGGAKRIAQQGHTDLPSSIKLTSSFFAQKREENSVPTISSASLSSATHQKDGKNILEEAKKGSDSSEALQKVIADVLHRQQGVKKIIDKEVGLEEARERIRAQEEGDEQQQSTTMDGKQPFPVAAGGSLRDTDAIQAIRDQTLNYLTPIYNNDRRLDLMHRAASNMQRYIVMVWSANAVRAFRRFPNPVIKHSYIEKLGLYDYQGNYCPPLEIFTKRGQARLPCLDGFDVLAMHGAKEALLLLDAITADGTRVTDPELRRFLKRGGRIWDTALGEYCLSGYLTEYPKFGLHDLCSRYGAPPAAREYSWNVSTTISEESEPMSNNSNTTDNGVAAAEAKQFMSEGNGIYKASSQVDEQTKQSIEAQKSRDRMNKLYKSHNDEETGEGENSTSSSSSSKRFATTSLDRGTALQACRSLATVFTQQVDRAFKQAQLLSLRFKMDSLLTHYEIERNGIFVNSKRAQVQVDDVRKELQATNDLLSTIKPEGLPVGYNSFDWNDFKHVEAYFFGGTIYTGIQRKAVMTSQVASALCNLAFYSNRFGYLKTHSICEAYCTAKKLKVRGGNYYGAARNHLVDEATEGGSENYEYKVVLFDLETTGLSTESDRIVEFSFFDLSTGKTFSSLVNPLRRIPQSSTRIHGISDDMVAGAPSFSAISKSICRFLNVNDNSARYKKKAESDARKGKPKTKIILMSHSCDTLDYPILTHQMDMAGCHLSPDEVIFADSLPLIQSVKEELKLPNAKLGDLVKYLQIQPADILAVNGTKVPSKIDSTTSTPNKKSNNNTSRTTTPEKKSPLQKEIEADAQNHLAVQDQVVSEVAYTGDAATATASHRAEYDTKALFKVLLAIFRFQDTRSLISLLVETLTLGDNHCFKMHCSEHMSSASFRLPGIVHQAMPDIADRQIEKMRKKTINSNEVAEAFAKAGVSAAELLMTKSKLLRSANIFDRNDAKLGTLHPDNCIRQEIRLASTSTGRTASCYPNCQNIPKEDKSRIREIFTSRFTSEGVVIEVDFKQLEIAILGLLAQDPRMLQDLENGVDFHLKRVAAIIGEAYDELFKKHKAGDKKVKKLRQQAKTVSFQRMYGAGAAAIQKTTGLDMDQVKAMISNEEVMYPGVARHHQLTRSVCLRRGNPGTSSHYMLELPTGARVALVASDVNFLMPPVKNYPIQSYGAEIVSMALARIFREFILDDRFQGKAYITNFVHDSIWLDCHESVAKEVTDMVSKIMSSVRDMLRSEFPGAPANVNFGVSASIGRNLYDTCSPEQWFAREQAMKIQQAAHSSTTIGSGPKASSMSKRATAAANSSKGRSTSSSSVSARQSMVATPMNSRGKKTSPMKKTNKHQQL